MIARRKKSTPLIAGQSDAPGVLRVARGTGRAVLRRTSATGHAPRVALAAIDFSPASMEATRVLYDLLPDGALLYLVHVLGNHAPLPSRIAATLHRAQTAQNAFDMLMETLEHVRHEVRVHEVWLSGDPAAQVLGFARDNHVDIIACGCCSGSPPQDARSFATKVLEGSPLPVLLVPGCAQKPEGAVAFDRLAVEVAR